MKIYVSLLIVLGCIILRGHAPLTQETEFSFPLVGRPITINNHLVLSDFALKYNFKINNDIIETENGETSLIINAEIKYEVKKNNHIVTKLVWHKLKCKINKKGTLTLDGSGQCQKDFDGYIGYMKIYYLDQERNQDNKSIIHTFNIKYGFITNFGDQLVKPSKDSEISIKKEIKFVFLHAR